MWLQQCLCSPEVKEEHNCPPASEDYRYWHCSVIPFSVNKTSRRHCLRKLKSAVKAKMTINLNSRLFENKKNVTIWKTVGLTTKPSAAWFTFWLFEENAPETMSSCWQLKTVFVNYSLVWIPMLQSSSCHVVQFGCRTVQSSENDLSSTVPP